MRNDTARAADALYAIPPDLPRDEWVKVGMAYHAAEGNFSTFDNWSVQADNYGAADCRDMWNSFKKDGGIGAGTLYQMAREHGWTDGKTGPQRHKPSRQTEPRKSVQDTDAAEIWSRCDPADYEHGYIVVKHAAGVPLETLRVVPTDDCLRIAGQSMAGFMMIPAYTADGEMQSAQFIPPTGGGKKVNLPRAGMAGLTFTVGPTIGPAHLCEGIGAAWAVWQATGQRSVVCFGWGNVRRVAESMRKQDPAVKLILWPDSGKESEAEKIASDVRAAIAFMPTGEANNFDANDLGQRDGLEVLAEIWDAATEPPNPEPRYKLLNSDDLRALPPLKWRVRGVLPADGLAGLYGPSASGKSFLALDMAAAIAEGSHWFGCRVDAAPVVYAALEGEAGFKLRAQAWEADKGRKLPDALQMMMQPFKLTEPKDLADLAAVVPAGAVVFLDTLNRAAPTADENSSIDMGKILSAAKQLQSLIGGLVVLVHHTGKDATKGLRGHSSLFAALDAAVEVSRDGDNREWRVAKSKDGADGDAQPFRLKVETLGVDEYGDPMTSCTVQSDARADDVKRVKLPRGRNQKLVYDAIRGLFKVGCYGKAGAPAIRPCIQLEDAVIRGASALACPSDKRTSRAREAITGLVSCGVLGLNDGFLWIA